MASEDIRIYSHIDNIFNKLQNRSKSPNNGFKLVKGKIFINILESLQKQKKLIKAHAPRNK